MPVVLSNISFADDSRDMHGYVDFMRHGALDILAQRVGKSSSYNRMHNRLALAMVRGIFRERNDITKFPEVIGFVAYPTNEYGHNLQMEVRYSKVGWLAVYAADIADPHKVQCYMD